MGNLNYGKIQSEIHRPQRLCLHCGRCMPIINGNNLDTNQIDTTLIRGPISVWDEFPEEFNAYISFLEEELGVPIKIVSVGPDRGETVVRPRA